MLRRIYRKLFKRSQVNNQIESNVNNLDETANKLRQIEADNASLIKALNEKTQHWEEAVGICKRIEVDNASLIKALDEKNQHWKEAVSRNKKLKEGLTLLNKTNSKLSKDIVVAKKLKENTFIKFFRERHVASIQAVIEANQAQAQLILTQTQTNKALIEAIQVNAPKDVKDIQIDTKIIDAKIAKIAASITTLEKSIRKDMKLLGAKTQENIIKRENNIIKQIHEAPTIQEIHTKTFAKYRSIYRDRDIVIVGSGPTLNYYEPIEDAVTIGANATFLVDKFRLDYLFLQDNVVLKRFDKNLLFEYPCKKFFSFIGTQETCLPLEFRELPDVEEFCKCTLGIYDQFMHQDITKSPLATFGSVIFPAVQFALWTYPRRIYIVGCDCNVWEKGYYDGSTNQENVTVKDERFINGWKKIKEFQSIYYPDVEMITINPVGLKGLFKDVFTKPYFEETYSNSLVSLKGHFADGWVEKSSDFCILTGATGEIIISGYYPSEITPELTGRITINGQENPVCITDNKFNFVFHVECGMIAYIHVEMDFENESLPPDTRKLCFVLKGIESK